MISLQDLHKMPLKEKLFLMEALWDDISTAEADLSVPQWQQSLLDEREAAGASGTPSSSTGKMRNVRFSKLFDEDPDP